MKTAPPPMTMAMKSKLVSQADLSLAEVLLPPAASKDCCPNTMNPWILQTQHIVTLRTPNIHPRPFSLQTFSSHSSSSLQSTVNLTPLTATHSLMLPPSKIATALLPKAAAVIRMAPGGRKQAHTVRDRPGKGCAFINLTFKPLSKFHF